ncbi:MAG: Polyamine aminopropyltransferase [Candidatus Anoxychlamydiales bacterium]|nr:Polyamine aminopropyltransferase [Candidatus Anoxychlamydiales bacterium]
MVDSSIENSFTKDLENTNNLDNFFVEKLYGSNWNQMLKISKVLFEGKSKFQDILIFENSIFGKVLALDNVLQTTENDEFIYHEMLTHVPILSHGNVKKVLIIGGADGGILREVLLHKSIEKATMVEIDGIALDACKKHMPKLSNGAFSDPKSEVIIADGIDYVKNTKEKFDIIIVDSTDPVGPGIVLFTKEFYTYCKKALNPDGIIVTQNGVPFAQGQELVDTYNTRKKIFEDNRFYIAPVFGYIGGFMALGWATDSKKHFNVSIDTLKKAILDLPNEMKYYTPEVHKASFQLPMYIQNKLK